MPKNASGAQAGGYKKPLKRAGQAKLPSRTVKVVSGKTTMGGKRSGKKY